MKIGVSEDHELEIRECFSGVGFITSDGESLGVCMRDSGYEITYQGQWWRLVGGEVNRMISPAFSADHQEAGPPDD